jgi:hypothetical protein
VQTKVAQEHDALRRQPGPVALRRRDNSIVEDSMPRSAPGSVRQKP